MIFCGVWVKNFVWNFKGGLWNFTQNFEPIHRKICILRGIKSLTNYDILKLCGCFAYSWEALMVIFHSNRHFDLVDVITKFPSNRYIAAYILKLCGCFAYSWEALMVIFHSNRHFDLVDVITKFPSNRYIAAYILKLCGCFAYSWEALMVIFHSNRHFDLVDVITKFPSNRYIAAYILTRKMQVCSDRPTQPQWIKTPNLCNI